MMDWNETTPEHSQKRKKKERKVIEREIERENSGNEENQVIDYPSTFYINVYQIERGKKGASLTLLELASRRVG